MLILKTSWEEEIHNPSLEQIEKALWHLIGEADGFVILENSVSEDFVQTCLADQGGFVVESWQNGVMTAQKTLSACDSVYHIFEEFYSAKPAKMRHSQRGSSSQSKAVVKKAVVKPVDGPVKSAFRNFVAILILIGIGLVLTDKLWLPPLVKALGQMDTGRTYEIPSWATPHTPGEEITQRGIDGYYCGELVQRASNKKLYFNFLYQKLSFPHSKSCRDPHEFTPVQGYFLHVPFLSRWTFGDGFFVYETVPYLQEFFYGTAGLILVFVAICVLCFFPMRWAIRRQARLAKGKPQTWPTQNELETKNKKWLYGLLVFLGIFGVAAGVFAKQPWPLCLVAGAFLMIYFWLIIKFVPVLTIRFPNWCVESLSRQIGMPVKVVAYGRYRRLVPEPGVEPQFFKKLFLELVLLILRLLGALSFVAVVAGIVFAVSKIVP